MATERGLSLWLAMTPILASALACVRPANPGPCGPQYGSRFLSCIEGASSVLDTHRELADPSDAITATESSALGPALVGLGYSHFEYVGTDADGPVKRRVLVATRSEPVGMQIIDRYAVVGLRTSMTNGVGALGEIVEVPVGLAMSVVLWPGMVAGSVRAKAHARLYQPGTSVVRWTFMRGYVYNWSSFAGMMIDPSIGALGRNPAKSKFDIESVAVEADGPIEAAALRRPAAGACLRVVRDGVEATVTTDDRGVAELAEETWPPTAVRTCDGEPVPLLEVEVVRGVP